ncbi:hypothetical protein [Actinocrispum sp. NPDC049592]
MYFIVRPAPLTEWAVDLMNFLDLDHREFGGRRPDDPVVPQRDLVARRPW